MAAVGGAPLKSGVAPLARKKRLPAAHIDRPRFAKLNTVCCAFIFQRNEILTPSSASVTIPTCGPNRSTEAKPNASETETRVSTEGTLRVSMPLAIVRIANSIHAGGSVDCTSTKTLWPTASSPQMLTAQIKTRPAAGSAAGASGFIARGCSVRAAVNAIAPHDVVRGGLVVAPDDVLSVGRLDRIAPDNVVSARVAGDITPDQIIRRSRS